MAPQTGNEKHDDVEGTATELDTKPMEQQPEQITDAQREVEKRIRHKFDGRVLPLGIVIYLAAQIDRSNMSNALVLGLKEQEHCSYCSRSEEHTSELQSLAYLVCRLLL